MWLLQRATSFRVLTFHACKFPSAEPERTYCPSGVNVASIVVFGEGSKLNPHRFSPAYASRTYTLLFVVVKSIDLPSLLNFISQTSAVSPPTKNVSKGPLS
uniref:Uncharacterized protein n=1 Tax=Opuntia streptacantha TaxID=393608 RepID=A0A7C9DJ59_OPUST